MITLALALLAAWAVIARVSGTPVARLFRWLLVDGPARALNCITRGHVMLAVLLALFVGLLTWQLKADGIRLLSLMAPEIVGWLTMFEIATCLDVLVAAITAASVVRFEGIRSLFRPRAPRPRARRTRVERPRADNDDGDRPAALPLAV